MKKRNKSVYGMEFEFLPSFLVSTEYYVILIVAFRKFSV
jgi:hypothetical protein